MNQFKIEKKHLIALAVVVVVAIIIFTWGKHNGKQNPALKNVKVEVDVEDERDGTTSTYNPTPMVDKVHKALSEQVWFWDSSPRCGVLNELLALAAESPVKFMAVVYGYQKKHKTTLNEALDACWVHCYIRKEYNLTQSVHELLKEKIETLSKVIKTI
jgi:hypothetical protein